MIECRDVQKAIWAGDVDAAPVAGHLEGCDACRLEVRRATTLREALSDLGSEFAPAPPTLEPALMAALQRSRMERARQVVYQPRFWRGAAVGAAAATAAAAFGVIVARRLARPDLAA